MLRIGDFAKLSQVSVKALRFYDQIGLLKPTFVDRATGYRYYAPDLLLRLNRLLAFKEMGLRLADILQLLETDLSDQQVRALLQRRRAELSRRIALEQVQLAQVDAWLQQLPAPANALEPHIRLKQMPAQLVASVRATIDAYDDADQLFDQLEHHLRGRKHNRQRAAIWHACADSSDRIDCEALILLNDRVPESSRVRIYQLPAGVTASVIHQGSDATIPQTYLAARRWIKAQGYAQAGPNLEYYWPEAREHANAASLTEIQFPLSITPESVSAGN